jgi:hypothetical protein
MTQTAFFIDIKANDQWLRESNDVVIPLAKDSNDAHALHSYRIR